MPLREDTLVVLGTAVNDTFRVASTGTVTHEVHANPAVTRVVIETPGVSVLTLNGLSGDDQFHVTGYTPAVERLPRRP